MSEQILMVLKRKLNELSVYGEVDVETRRNALKEELQFYVLNFIYHHPEYSQWTMYGGSALRICHGLDRMSVDLDFEVRHAVTDTFLNELKDEIEKYFLTKHGVSDGFLMIKITNGRGLKLIFPVGDELGLGHSSKQVHVKIDLNHFVAPKTVIDKRPINRDQLSFVITTYNMSALMASKIAAIFLRGTRGVGKDEFEEKGRDIYDLLWYMGKKVIPDLDYLIAKKIDVKDVRVLFDKLTLKMNAVSDTNLKQDLTPLFVNQTYIKNWLANWRESYLRLFEGYKIRTIGRLDGIKIYRDLQTDNSSFVFTYHTAEKEIVSVVYIITYEWLLHEDLNVEIREDVVNIIDFGSRKDRDVLQLKQYATLFWQKTGNYFKKTNHVMIGDSITTKVIRVTADNLNQKEQIVLNKSALVSCELDDLLK
jgi:hypothetical protein